MNDLVALALILLLAMSGYTAGRLHGQFGYRWGFRNGYRQGYFDGDRASWNRRRRDLQAAVASVLTAVTDPDHRGDAGFGTMYTSSSRSMDDVEADAAPGPVPSVPHARGRHSREPLAGVGSDS